MILLFYSFATLLVILRLIKGPTFADRLLTLDLLANISVLSIITYAIMIDSTLYIDIAIAIVLLSFIGTLSIVKWVEKK